MTKIDGLEIVMTKHIKSEIDKELKKRFEELKPDIAKRYEELLNMRNMETDQFRCKQCGYVLDMAEVQCSECDGGHFERLNWTKGGDGSHWDGCAEVHWDCRIAQLEKENARLTAELAELKETKIADIEKGLFFGKPVEYWLRLQNQAQESKRDKDIEEILLLKSLVFAREQDLNELHIELSQLRERTRWIPVSERLPEPPTTCLTFCEDWVEEDYFDSKGWLSGKPVTHWMPLPEPPEATDADN